MEIKLNIYDDNKQLVKEYCTETLFLPLGVVEDLLELVDVDTFEKGTDAEIAKAALKLVKGGFGSVKELLKVVFDGLTDAELKYTNALEIVAVIVKIVKYSMIELSRLASGKNV